MQIKGYISVLIIIEILSPGVDLLLTPTHLKSLFIFEQGFFYEYNNRHEFI